MRSMPPVFARWRTAAVFTSLAASIAGCSDPSEAPAPEATACSDAAVIESCLVEQKACTRAPGGADTCIVCAAGEYVDAAGACQSIAGTALGHDFPENTTPPGGELRGLCRSWTLDNDEALWVNAVQLSQSEASHHSNWTYVPEDMFDGPDGIWPCKDRDYDQLSAALAGGVLYAQSTQAVRETQKFPDGAALRIPARARLISDIHTLNTSSETVTGHLSLTLFAIPEADVTVKLAPFHVDYHGLQIPPMATSRFSGACELTSSFDAQGHPFELDVYYLLPHTHELGSRMFVEIYGGPDDAKTLIDVRGNIGEPRGRSFDPPVEVRGATGLRFGCEFQNPRDETIGWGFDDQEMCEALGFAKSPVIFETRIGTAEADGADGDTKLFTGPCDTLAVEWNN